MCVRFDCELGVVVDQTFPSFLWMDGSRRDGENLTLINKALDICIYFFFLASLSAFGCSKLQGWGEREIGLQLIFHLLGGLEP